MSFWNRIFGESIDYWDAVKKMKTKSKDTYQYVTYSPGNFDTKQAIYSLIQAIGMASINISPVGKRICFELRDFLDLIPEEFRKEK